jgi:hypothetical protein
MNTFEELKSFCDKEIVKYPQYKKRYNREIAFAKIYYNNGRNLYNELNETKESLSKRYIIPFLLGFTNEVIDLEPEFIQVKDGASGGIDIDSDFSPEGKEKIQQYLKNKYGEENVVHVGTYSAIGPASAAKDLLRIYKVDFKQSVSFTKELDKNLSWEENIERIKSTNQTLYNFYLQYQQVLDLVPYFINKIRQESVHAGGIVITPEPIYKYIPVDRVSGELITAFPENGQETILDELGLIKIDLLAISILEVIDNTIDSIDEKIYLIEDDDGIIKAVSESYINNVISKF